MERAGVSEGQLRSFSFKCLFCGDYAGYDKSPGRIWKCLKCGHIITIVKEDQNDYEDGGKMLWKR